MTKSTAGAGLIELHRVYPQARLDGLEWSWPLTLLCRLYREHRE